VVIEIIGAGRLDVMRPLGRYLPPLVLMATIFVLSAQSDLNSGLGWMDFVGRKLVHMTEYGLLWILWVRALGWQRRLAAFAISFAYAASDEFHQTFVRGRHGTPRDVAIDTAGILLAWALIELRRRRLRARPRTG
jgi:VanZ family protein